MVVSKPVFFWKANVEIETQNLSIKAYTFKGKEGKRDIDVIDKAHQQWIVGDSILY